MMNERYAELFGFLCVYVVLFPYVLVILEFRFFLFFIDYE